MAPQQSALQSGGKPVVLPWERNDGDPAGTGICLSGGGIRAAMFSLGVLQRLQEKRGLVFGEGSADVLSVVSGGSYMAGSHALGALARTANPAGYGDRPPLAKGSPEEDHILSNGEYLWRNPHTYAWFAFLNLVSVFSLFGLLGFIFASLATIQRWIVLNSDTPRWIRDAYGWLDRLWIGLPIAGFAVFFFLAVVVFARSAPFPRRLVGVMLLLAAAAICIYPCLQYGENNLDWRATNFFRGLLIAVGIVLLIVTVVPRLVKDRGPEAFRIAINWIGLFAPRGLAFILIAWIAVWLYPNVPEAIGRRDRQALDGWETTLLVLLLVPLVLGRLPLSLHREYRNRLMSCYAVTRDGDGVNRMENIEMSRLAPLDGSDALSFPRLLISATANVRPPGEPGWWRSPRGILKRIRESTTFLSYVLSHDACGSPGIARTKVATTQLELAQVPTNLLNSKREPLLSLFTAIACTGAAVSPNMGYQTIASIRPFIAALNFRLGRWFPNPYNARARKALASLTGPGVLEFRSAFGDESDELLTEIMGLYGPRMYISDGGHYDNRGLLALLRARCQTIYCVDAGSHPTGHVRELQRLIDAAVEAKIIEPVDGTTGRFDFSAFGSTSGEPFRETHRTGTFRYAGSDEPCTLIVLKLGLVETSDTALKDRAQLNRASFLHKPIVLWALGALIASPLLALLAMAVAGDWWWPAMIATSLVALAALPGLWFWQLRPANSALGGYFPHHSTFGKIGFNRDEATAYRNVGWEIVDRYLATQPVSATR